MGHLSFSVEGTIFSWVYIAPGPHHSLQQLLIISEQHFREMEVYRLTVRIAERFGKCEPGWIHGCCCVLSSSFCSCSVTCTSQRQGWGGFMGVVKEKRDHLKKWIGQERNLNGANRSKTWAIQCIVLQTYGNSLFEICLLWVVIGPNSLISAYTFDFIFLEWMEVLMFQSLESRSKEKKDCPFKLYQYSS